MTDEDLPNGGGQTTAIDFASAREMVAGTEVGTHGAIARVEAELKGAMVLAKQFPRDEEKAFQKIMKTCDRPGFAEAAIYSFPRGKSQVTGPSVDLAREVIKIWGNSLFGLRILSITDEEVHIVGYAYDAETNTRAEAEDKFPKKHQRKVDAGGGRQIAKWITIDDERDLRELINRRGAICVRNAILQVLPADVVDAALARCRHTKVKGAGKDFVGQVRKWVEWFGKNGVSIEMLEKRLGHPLKDIDKEEFSDLQGVAKSMADGHTKREDHFAVAATPEPERQRPGSTRDEGGGGKRAEADPSGNTSPRTAPTPENAADVPVTRDSGGPSAPDSSPAEPETTDKEDAVAASRVKPNEKEWTGTIARVRKVTTAKNPESPVDTYYVAGHDKTEFSTTKKFLGVSAEALKNTGEKAIVRYVETLRGNDIVNVSAAPVPKK